MKSVCVVAAVRDEEANLRPFVDSLLGLRFPAGIELRILFIEDSSKDATRTVLDALSREHENVGYFCLEKGFGQGPAIVFGMRHVRADAYIMMDADGSHPSAAVPTMIELAREGAEVVQCVRRTLANRRSYRQLGTALFQRVARIATGVDTRSQNIFYRLTSSAVAEQLLATPRYWRWLRFPLPASTRFLEIDTVERVHGRSKYGLFRLIGLAIDGVLSVTPTRRLLLLLVASAVLVAWSSRHSTVRLLVGLGIITWLCVRYYRMAHDDVLARMRVKESANVPRVPPTAEKSAAPGCSAST